MRVASALLVAALLAIPRVASADAMACIEAHAEGQRAERRGELKTARARYAECTGFECPAAVRHDCDGWRVKVDQAIPSIIVRTKDAESANVAVKVWIDDVLLSAAKSGIATELDPGPHKVRVEAETFQPAEQSVVVSAGEKERVIDVPLTPIARPSPPPMTTTVVPPSPPPPSSKASPSPWPYVLGGVGVVGLGVFTGVAIGAKSRFDTLYQRCAPSCSTTDANGVRHSYVVADVALAIGATALIASAVWLAVRAFSHEQPVH